MFHAISSIFRKIFRGGVFLLIIKKSHFVFLFAFYVIFQKNYHFKKLKGVGGGGGGWGG